MNDESNKRPLFGHMRNMALAKEEIELAEQAMNDDRLWPAYAHLDRADDYLTEARKAVSVIARTFG